MGIPFFFSQFSATKLKENKIKQMMLTSSGNAQPKAQYNSTQITAQPNLVRAIDSNLSRVTRLLSLPDEHHILIIIKNAHLISLPPSLSTYSWFCLFCSFFFYWGGGFKDSEDEQIKHSIHMGFLPSFVFWIVWGLFYLAETARDSAVAISGTNSDNNRSWDPPPLFSHSFSPTFSSPFPESSISRPCQFIGNLKTKKKNKKEPQ